MDVAVRVGLALGLGDFFGGLLLVDGLGCGVERSAVRDGRRPGVQGSGGGVVDTVVGATLRGGGDVSGGSAGILRVGRVGGGGSDGGGSDGGVEAVQVDSEDGVADSADGTPTAGAPVTA